jgi:hypothetical protein
MFKEFLGIIYTLGISNTTAFYVVKSLVITYVILIKLTRR